MASVATQPIPNKRTGEGIPIPSQPLADFAVAGAITLVAGGIARLTGASAQAYTLALPAAPGIILQIHSVAAVANTVDVAGGLAGTSADNLITFSAAANNGIALYSSGGYWHIVPGTNVNGTVS